MKITVLSTIGFCFGVERSLKLCNDALADQTKPHYLLGMLVHNSLVQEHLLANGAKIITMDELDELIKQNQDAYIISTAHGISLELKNKINQSTLTLIDTTCPIVLKNNDKIKNYYDKGYGIIYLGKKHHAESNIVKSIVHIVESVEDISNLNIKIDRIAVVNQTTMSTYDFEVLSKAIKQKYPDAIFDLSICSATKKRQDELQIALDMYHSEIDHWLVIGDHLSNNTNKLYQLISNVTPYVSLIENKEQINSLSISSNTHFIITSGTSVSIDTINEIVETIKEKSRK